MDSISHSESEMACQIYLVLIDPSKIDSLIIPHKRTAEVYCTRNDFRPLSVNMADQIELRMRSKRNRISYHKDNVNYFIELKNFSRFCIPSSMFIFDSVRSSARR